MTCDSCGSFRRRESAAQYDAIAELYDGYPGNYLEDVLFFVEEARASGSPVMEVGVGTGRLAFCLAAVGLDVVGIDSSPEMLRSLARQKEAVGELPGRVRVLASDMRTLALRQRFRLAIVAFRTFLYMLTRADQRRALRAIRRHLEPGGRLAMAFFVPPAELLAQGRTEEREVTRFAAPGGEGEVVVRDWTEFVARGQRVISHITYERQEAGRVQRRLKHELVARYVFPEEVPPLLESCGFRVAAAYGDFDRRPLGDDSREQIWIAERREKRQP
jgi:SAM-dependent methyltransferase